LAGIHSACPCPSLWIIGTFGRILARRDGGPWYAIRLYPYGSSVRLRGVDTGRRGLAVGRGGGSYRGCCPFRSSVGVQWLAVRGCLASMSAPYVSVRGDMMEAGWLAWLLAGLPYGVPSVALSCCVLVAWLAWLPRTSASRPPDWGIVERPYTPMLRLGRYGVAGSKSRRSFPPPNRPHWQASIVGSRPRGYVPCR